MNKWKTHNFESHFFSAQKYDFTAFNQHLPGSVTIEYFSQPLCTTSAKLAEVFDAVYCFVNDDLKSGGYRMPCCIKF